MTDRVLKVTTVVVVYNTSISDSKTCSSLLACEHPIDVLVVDNSEVDYGNRTACEKSGFRYVSHGRNLGISKAYNEAIDLSRDSDVIVLFDDDTDVPQDYFAVLFDALVSRPDVDIFAPVVIGQDGVIYSPNRSNFLRNELVQDAQAQIEQDRFNAIASCLAIRMHVFDCYRFNEVLFVDQVDQNFFDDMRAVNRTFAKLNVTVRQSFYQRGSSLTPEQGWRRLRLRIIDLMRYARLKNSVKYTFLGYVKCCGLGLQISRKTGDVRVALKALGLSTATLIIPR